MSGHGEGQGPGVSDETADEGGEQPETTRAAVEGAPPVHLVGAEGGITERYRGKLYFFSECGTVLEETELPHASCMEEECGGEVWYCRDCIRAVVEWNVEVGVPGA